jgi:hypothetical protein
MSGMVVSSKLRNQTPAWRTERDFVWKGRAASVKMARDMAWERCHLDHPEGEFEVLEHEIIVRSSAANNNWGEYRVVVRGTNLFEQELEG